MIRSAWALFEHQTIWHPEHILQYYHYTNRLITKLSMRAGTCYNENISIIVMIGSGLFALYNFVQPGCCHWLPGPALFCFLLDSLYRSYASCALQFTQNNVKTDVHTAFWIPHGDTRMQNKTEHYYFYPTLFVRHDNKDSVYYSAPY